MHLRSSALLVAAFGLSFAFANVGCAEADFACTLTWTVDGDTDNQVTVDLDFPEADNADQASSMCKAAESSQEERPEIGPGQTIAFNCECSN